MHIGLTISDRSLTRPVDTSLLLALEAVRHGHTVSVFGIGDLAIDEHGGVSACSTTFRPPAPGSTSELQAQLAGEAPPTWIDLGVLDVLLLRADPNEGPGARTWSQQASIRLGQRVAALGVDVVNDPAGLLLAADKTYLSRLPPELVPRSIVSCDPAVLRSFIGALGGPTIVKPVSGAGGRRVFRVADAARDPNLSQMLDLAGEDGYVMVQEWVGAAAESTHRVFLVDGAPLVVGGRHAALRHCPGPHDHRSNIHAGGSVARAMLSAADVAAAEAAAPPLARDGLLVAGLDLAGGRILEVNVFSPGGLFGIERFEGPGFAAAIVDWLVARRSSRGD